MPRTNENPRARVKARQFTECRVPGCDRFVSGLSRYCARHKMNHLRYGSPLARMISKRELRPYERMVSRFISENQQHPQILQVFMALDRMLAEAASIAKTRSGDDTPRLRPRDWRARRVRELSRLNAAGVTGSAVYRATAAIWLLRHFDRNGVGDGRSLRFAISRTVFNLAKRYQHDNGKHRVTERISTLVLDNLGDELLSLLTPTLNAMTRAIEQARSSAPPSTTGTDQCVALT